LPCTVDLEEIMTLIGYRMVIDATSVEIDQSTCCVLIQWANLILVLLVLV
jgi:hypothetical protein